MKLLLTDGTGFFGRALLRHWLMLNQQNSPPVLNVTVLTRSPETFCTKYPEFRSLPWLHFQSGDILHSNTLPHKQSFTHILHAAADSTTGPELSPLQRYEQIVTATRNLLDLALECGVQRFLLTSSGAVYGAQPQEMVGIPESYHGIPDPLNPKNAYGLAKRTAEHLCALYQNAYGLETVIARCFAFVGRDLPLDVHFAVGNFIRDALWRDAIIVAGDGSPVRSYLDQCDLAAWLLVLLEKGQSAQAYNVGSDEAITIRDLAYLVRDTLAPDKPVHIQRESAADNAHRNRYVPDVSKIRNELGVQIQIPLTDAIRATACQNTLDRRG